MSPRNRIILLAGELIIPILGYFWWNWNLYFIFLFMFLDLFSYNFLYLFKSRSIAKYRMEAVKTTDDILWIFILLGLMMVVFLGYSFFLNSLQQTVFSNEILAFLSYKDLGFSQGYILLPFVFIAAWMNYKTEFQQGKRFAKIGLNALKAEYLKDNFAAIILLFFLVGLSWLGVSNQIVLLIIGLFFYSLYKLI